MSNNPADFVVDPAELDLGELCELEEIVGQPAFEALRGMSAKTIRAVVFLLRRRQEPGYTFDATAKLKLSDVQFAGVDEGDE